MYIYFDRNGTIQEVINDESIRKGSNDYNKIYCYLEGNPDIDDIWYLQKNPDGTLTNEVSFVDNIVTKAIPYDAKRDMKYFQDFEEYQFYVFTLSSSYLLQNGLVVATIRVAENNTMWALGELTFNVQANVINSDNDITQSQYDYLLLTISSYYSKTEIDNKLDLKADKSDTYTKAQVDNKLDLKADKSTTYTKTQVDNKLDLKADLNNHNQDITARVYNSIGGYFYIVGPNATTQYYSDRIYNSTNALTWLFPSAGGTFALTSQISSLQTQINTLKSVQNVVEVVATKSALNSYDTSKLEANDKVQVIADESHDGASTIYNWSGSAWQYVGAYGGNSYTKTETDTLLNAKASKNGSASEDFTTNNLTVSGNETLAGDLVYNGNTSLTSKMATKADLNNNNQQITAKVFNSINGYFYITGPNVTTQYYSDRIYNSTNSLTWLFPSTGGTFALTSQIASAKSELQTQITANADKIDNAINNLRWELGSHTLDVVSDTTTAYTKTVPSGAIGCQINKIGGMSYKINQLAFPRGAFTTQSGSFTITDNIVKFTATAQNGQIIHTDAPTTLAHNYLSCFKAKLPNGYLMQFWGGTSSNSQAKIITGTGNYELYTLIYSSPYAYWILRDVNSSNFQEIEFEQDSIMIFDLTAMGIDTTDVATATTELLKRGIDINEYQAYDSGSIRDSAITSVVSKDTNATTLDTLTIPSAVQALDGYGMGYDETCNNYIDFNPKKFVKMYHRYTFTGNESWNYNSTAQRWQTSITVDNSLIPPTNNTTKARLSVNVKVSIISNTYQRAGWEVFGTTGKLNFYINDNDELPSTTNPNTLFVSGKTLDYELATPIKTDISEYLDDNSIEVEPNGTLTFNNTYEQAVPSDIDYLIEEVKA